MFDNVTWDMCWILTPPLVLHKQKTPHWSPPVSLDNQYEAETDFFCLCLKAFKDVPLWKTLQTLTSVTNQKSDDQTHGFTIAVTHKPQGKKTLHLLYVHSLNWLWISFNKGYSLAPHPTFILNTMKKLVVTKLTTASTVHLYLWVLRNNWNLHLDFSKFLTYIPAGIVPSCCATLCSYHLHQWRNAVLHLLCTNEILKIDSSADKASWRNVICQMIFTSYYLIILNYLKF